MNDYKVIIRLRSSVITPFQSDTIFGHICWAIRFLWGNDFLDFFLNEYSNKEKPLLTSTGFPEGYLPKPILPPVNQAFLEKFLDPQQLKIDAYKIKFIKKIELIPITIFDNFCEEEPVTSDQLFKSLYNIFDSLQDIEEAKTWKSIRHNTVNRIKNRVEQGLYDQEECFLKPLHDRFTIYIKSNLFNKIDFETIFGFIGENGFGKDKHTGKGYFIVEGINEILKLPECNEPNAFMTLSSFIPQPEDPTHGYYQFIQKYGKTGGLFATGNPFKKPVLMLAPGSVFFGKAPSGLMVENVHHTRPEIKHYAYAFPMGICLKEERNENN